MRNDRQHLERVMAAVMLGYHAQVRGFVLPALEGWLTYATSVTQRGTVVVEFFGADTPLTVSDLVALARRVVTAASRFIASSRTSWHRTAIHAVMEVMGQGTRFAMS